MAEDDDDDDLEEIEVICCQGPPACELDGDDAVAAALAGCLLCKRIIISPDGTEHETAPSLH